jgi:ubiquinone/menaquinone biosynthesis C-methylase UbiE
MGFFTTTIAASVGDQGRVYCVDVEARMLSRLRSRLERRGLSERVETRTCSATDLSITDLRESIDLAILIHVLHEMQDPQAALQSIAQSLRPNGKVLLLEPAGHVSTRLFEAELAAASAVGLTRALEPIQLRSRRNFGRILSLTHQ